MTQLFNQLHVTGYQIEFLVILQDLPHVKLCSIVLALTELRGSLRWRLTWDNQFARTRVLCGCWKTSTTMHNYTKRGSQTRHKTKKGVQGGGPKETRLHLARFRHCDFVDRAQIQIDELIWREPKNKRQ